MLVELNAREAVLALLPKAGVGAEVGVFRGDFSAELLRVAKPAKLHLIDPWVSLSTGPHREAWYGATHRSQADMDAIHAHVLSRFDRQMTTGRIVVHRSPSGTALAELPDKSLDWLYIDGDHSYDGVRLDLRLGLGKIKPGGVLCGDDYTTEGWWKDGVIRALHDFLHESGSRVRIKMLIDAQFVLTVA